MTVRFFAYCLAILALGASAPTPVDVAHAQDNAPATISGRLINGTPDAAFDPTTMAVTLNIFEGVTTFDPVSTKPGPDGTFSFSVDANPNRLYFLTAEYQGATYSATLQTGNLETPVELTVFEATPDVSVLRFSSYSIIVTGAVPSERWIEVLERASVLNESGTTLVPDLSAEGPAMLNFLRFAVPAGAYNLDVRSTVVGGEILTVDRGFAMTTPIPPTSGEPHLVEFVYRLPYDGDTVDLSRTMRFGAESVRYVIPADVGRPEGPGLTDLGATELNGRFLRLLEGTDIRSGDVLDVQVTELPQPHWVDTLGIRAGDWYVLYVAPTIIVLALGGLVIVMSRRRALLPHIAPAEGSDSARRQLLERIAALDAEHRAGRLSARLYASAREEVRRQLIGLRLAEESETRADTT